MLPSILYQLYLEGDVLGLKTSVENSKKIGKGASKSKKPSRRKGIKEHEKKKITEAGDKLERASSKKSVRSETSSRRTIRSDDFCKRTIRSGGSSRKSRMSLFTSEQPVQNLSLLNESRQAFETSESELLPTDISSDTSSTSGETENLPLTQEQRQKNVIEEKENHGSEICNDESNDNQQTVKSFDKCHDCNGKVINDALSLENIQLLRGIKSREKKLKDTRRQLTEERAFYEQQKMDLCKVMTKKKSKSQIIQTDESALEVNTTLKELECQVANLKQDLEKEFQKSSKLKEKCQHLKKKNGQLRSEISLNEEDYEKSWKEVQDKLDKYKKECGNAEKNSGIIKNVYDQVLKKNAYLARSNFVLQAELRRLYRKFEHIDKSPSVKVLTSNSKSVQSESSPDLRRRQRDEINQKKKKLMRRSKTVPGRRSFIDDNSENLVVSGSLISVHVEGEEKLLRPVFLVLDEKKKKGSKKSKFGNKQDGNKSESSALRPKETKNKLTQRAKSAITESQLRNKNPTNGSPENSKISNTLIQKDKEALLKQKKMEKGDSKQKQKETVNESSKKNKKSINQSPRKPNKNKRNESPQKNKNQRHESPQKHKKQIISPRIHKNTRNELPQKGKNTECKQKTKNVTSLEEDNTNKNEVTTYKTKHSNDSPRKNKNKNESLTQEHKSEINEIAANTIHANESSPEPERKDIVETSKKNTALVEDSMKNTVDRTEDYNSDLKNIKCSANPENNEVENVPKTTMMSIPEANTCSDSENCIIECRTHSSSVQ